MKIRFLTLTPQQFAEVGATSNLLSQSEKFAILMNICSPSAAVPMPDGFSTSTVPRRKKSIADSYCSVSDFIKIFKFPPKTRVFHLCYSGTARIRPLLELLQCNILIHMLNITSQTQNKIFFILKNVFRTEIFKYLLGFVAS